MHYNMPAVNGQQLWAVRIWRRRPEAGARSSTLPVAAAAIARNHKDADLDVPVHHGVARTARDDRAQNDAPDPSRRSRWTWTAISPYGRRRTSRVRVGAASGARGQRPQPGSGGHCHDGPDAERQAAGERGCRPDLGRGPAPARRLRPGACRWPYGNSNPRP